MNTPLHDSPDVTLTRLARDHAEQLRWLQHKFGASLSDEELEDILQEAHEDAVKSLRGERPPSFPDWVRAVAWFRKVCSNTAIDALRRRDGRRRSARAARPTAVSLDALVEHHGDREPALMAEDPLEAMAAACVSDEAHRAITEALRQLPEPDARILYWRYADNLEPAAIVRLERLTSLKQYERRHTRAVKALGRALAGLELNLGCGQARVILRRQPEALLAPALAGVALHIDECPACRAFQLRVRGALAAMPLSPAALGAKLILGHTASSSGQPVSPLPTGASRGGRWASAVTHSKLAAAVAAAALAMGAGALTADADGDRAPRTRSVSHASPSGRPSHVFRTAESLADHLRHDPLTRR